MEGIDLQSTDPEGHPVLHAAVLEMDLDLVQCLLTAGASVDARDMDDWTPLHTAAWQGQSGIADMLLVAGASVDARDMDDWTPLHMAAWQGRTGVADVLLAAGASVDARDMDDWTPLHMAAWQGQTEVANVLLAAGASVDARDTDGWTPLRRADQQGRTEVAALLRDADASLDAGDIDNGTPLPVPTRTELSCREAWGSGSGRYRVRHGPGTQHAHTGRYVSPGEPICELQRDRGWVQVRLANGTTGWVHADGITNRLPTPTPAVPPTPTAVPAAQSLAELRLYALHLINHERTSQGLEPVDLAYNEGAQRHADDMAVNGYDSHWNLRGERPSMRYTWAGGHDYSAENLVRHYYVDASDGVCLPPISQQVLDEMTADLMDSPGHRDNILTPLHREVNLGIAASCHHAVLVQVFEGEYVHFSRPPELQGGRFAMAGQVAAEVALNNDNTYVTIAWDPPLTAYTKGQVAQTYCDSIGIPVARILPPLPPGYSWVDEPEIWERCPAPWDADPNLKLPEHEAEINQRSQRIRDGFMIRETVEVPSVTASTWQTEAGTFRIEADLASVVQTRGPGIYSVILWGEVDGQLKALTEYAIRVG